MTVYQRLFSDLYERGIPWSDDAEYQDFLHTFSKEEFEAALDDFTTSGSQVPDKGSYARYVHYEKRWLGVLERVIQTILAGEDNAARVLYLTDFRLEGWYTRTSFDTRTDFVLHGRLVRQPKTVAQATRDGVLSALLAQAVRRETEAIVELGAGTAHQLMRLWLRGAPPGIQFVACEITRSGRLVGEVLAALEPRLKWCAHRFDFFNADLSHLHCRFDSVLLYTRARIEQIPDIPSSFLDALFEICPNVRCVHFEPIGWQMGGEDPDHLSARSRAYSLKAGHNTNLWSTLLELEASGRIRIERSIRDVVGSCDYNPMSYVEWHKV